MTGDERDTATVGAVVVGWAVPCYRALHALLRQGIAGLTTAADPNAGQAVDAANAVDTDPVLALAVGTVAIEQTANARGEAGIAAQSRVGAHAAWVALG